jgi:ABC-2 type transport system ATP-binding protein
MSPDAITIDGIVKTFGDVVAVNGISLAVPRGQTVALLGPNGAGKSTTTSMLLGLLRPDRGHVALFDQNPDHAVRRGQVGAMPQEGGLINRVTVAELVRFVAGTHRHPMPLDQILAVAHLTDLADKRADRLSGGQGQRVRFALAISGDPDLIILDEPTAALDVSARREFWASMRRFAARGKTILFSTHYLEEADEHADRVIVIDRGRVVADGTSDDVKRSVAVTNVSVAVDGPASHLTNLPGVTAMEIRGRRVLLRTSDADATVIALASIGAVHDIEVARANLEDAFLALTEHATPATPISVNA